MQLVGWPAIVRMREESSLEVILPHRGNEVHQGDHVVGLASVKHDVLENPNGCFRKVVSVVAPRGKARTEETHPLGLPLQECHHALDVALVGSSLELLNGGFHLVHGCCIHDLKCAK